MEPAHIAWGLLVLLHGLCALAVMVHALSWLHLILLRQRPLAAPSPSGGTELPTVTVQLPLFNEEEQVEALLACVGALDWPAERMLIQVLDDSTDGTPRLVERALAVLVGQGLCVEHLVRQDRSGFKAGALAAGLETARGELIAIFDADFRPEPDFLRRAHSALGEDLGLVQARWSFRNAGDSARTRAQALHLDAHFALEQQARSSAGLLMGFNGTAGLWRRECIEAAGGWHADTLTEDLDLAYRAQLAGWRLGYVDAVAVDSELPRAMPAIRAQQHRWIRGGAQVARKLLGKLWSSPQSLRRKLHGTAHLLASSVFLPVLVLVLLTPLLPAALATGPVWLAAALAPAGVLLRVTLLALVLSFSLVCRWREGSWPRGLRRLVLDFPVYLGLAIAIAPWCARAAWMGWTAPTGVFQRTPKGTAQLRRSRWPVTLPHEGLLCLGSWLGVGSGLLNGQLVLAAFIGLQAVALTSLVALTLQHRWSASSTEAVRTAPQR